MRRGSVGEISDWRESLIRLNDIHFFEIVRMYLGEVKTPYNKQKLIEELAAFLHRDKNRQALEALLSPADLLILTAVKQLSCATREKLSAFFSSVFSLSALHERLMNLEERLILFRKYEELQNKYHFALNPLVKDIIEPLLDINFLLPAASVSSQAKTIESEGGSIMPALSSGFLGAWFAFTSANRDLCRTDGTFKKKAKELLSLHFPAAAEDFLLKLNTSLIHLSLFKQGASGLIPNTKKWHLFACLSPSIQYAYIAVASCGYFPREKLYEYAALVNSISACIPPAGYTQPVLLKAAFLLQEELEDSFCSTGRRFSNLLQKTSGNIENESNFNQENFLKTLIQAMLFFGLLKIAGTDAAGDNILVSALKEESDDEESQKIVKNSISIDAGFSVTVLKDLPLRLVIDLVQCMDLVRFDTVCRYEISRAACMRCFAHGTTIQDILHVLEKTASFALPQNLLFSLEEWYKAYNAASLFKGYVLRVSPEKQVHIENNPAFAPYISMSLAAGVYLLDFASDEEAASAVQKSGLDFIGEIKNLRPEQEALPFMPLPAFIPEEHFCTPLQDSRFHPQTVKNISKESDPLFIDVHLANMKGELKKKNYSREQAEELLFRIERKIILNAEQLRENSVRPEKTEAGGMDFVGKVHIIEQAISASGMIEIVFGANTFIGLPISIEKHTGDAFVFMQLEGRAEKQIFSIGQIRFVKRIRSSIFKRD